MTTLELAILKYLYKSNISCLTIDGNVDKDNCQWAMPVTKTMWNNAKSLDDFKFFYVFEHFLHFFVKDFTNEEIFNALGFLLVNSYIEQDEKFVTSYTITPEGRNYCINNDIIPIKCVETNPIGYKYKH